MKRLSILIADDSPDVCSLLEIWLAEHHVVSVHSGAAALSALALLHFDIVVADIHMPDVSGTDIIHRLRSTQPSVRVIAISGGSQFLPSCESVAATIKAGADAAILKPFNESQVLAAIESCAGTVLAGDATEAQVGAVPL